MLHFPAKKLDKSWYRKYNGFMASLFFDGAGFERFPTWAEGWASRAKFTEQFGFMPPAFDKSLPGKYWRVKAGVPVPAGSLLLNGKIFAYWTLARSEDTGALLFQAPSAENSTPRQLAFYKKNKIDNIPYLVQESVVTTGNAGAYGLNMPTIEATFTPGSVIPPVVPLRENEAWFPQPFNLSRAVNLDEWDKSGSGGGTGTVTDAGEVLVAVLTIVTDIQARLQKAGL